MYKKKKRVKAKRIPEADFRIHHTRTPQTAGETITDAKGYTLVYRPDFPGARIDGWASRARVVYWERTGVVLSAAERLRRINGNRTDDRFENLAVLDFRCLDGKRACTACGESKQLEEFFRRKRGSIIGACKVCTRKLLKEKIGKSRAAGLDFVLMLKADPCADCGKRFPAPCMDFDHVRGKKYFSISKATRSARGMATLIREMRKCDLVCANCHRVRTAIRREQGWLPDCELPEQTNVELPAAHVDARGSLQPLVQRELGAVVVIQSVAGTVRANHFHLNDWHYVYLLSGKMHYYERPIKSDVRPSRIEVTQGQLIFTPSLVEHSMVFLEDSVFIAMGNRDRTPDEYERDLVRFEHSLAAIYEERAEALPIQTPPEAAPVTDTVPVPV